MKRQKRTGYDSQITRSGTNTIAYLLLVSHFLASGYTFPELAHTLALKRAVLLARDGSFQDVIFSSDCLSLIQRITSQSSDRSPTGVVVAEIKRQAAMFLSAVFIHVHRSSNDGAHFSYNL
jgi:hypothetical protein